MIKKVNARGSKKRQRFSPASANQSLMTNFYFVGPNPNSQLNVGNISVFEENDDEDVVKHKRNKRVILEDEDEVHISSFEENDDEDVVKHKRSKRVILEDEDEVPAEVPVLDAEDVPPKIKSWMKLKLFRRKMS